MVVVVAACGCGDDIDAVREIQARRQTRLQTESQQDHLGDTFGLLNQAIELDSTQFGRQVSYHLNQWLDGRTENPGESRQLTKLIDELAPLLEDGNVESRGSRDFFAAADVDHIRDAYLFSRIVRWVDLPKLDDPLLADWFDELAAEWGEEPAQRLRSVSRLFDWTIRNIAHEPLQTRPALAGPPPQLPSGLPFEGPGYRQTDYQTVWRGTGDWMQRAGVFIRLCQQIDVPAFVLGTAQTGSDLDGQSWAVGVLIGERVYLFEPNLGTFIPGPRQVGIATLEEARRDASVMRRLDIQGFFDYPFSKSDVQQNVALLNVTPEDVAPRMAKLEAGLTGDRRMKVFVDADALAERLEAIPGISQTRVWPIPLMAEIYNAELRAAAMTDPILQFWYLTRWASLDASTDASQTLALGRWRHLTGQFDNDEATGDQGARVLYLQRRAPEFEIQDLNINVDLQKAYGIRRGLGMDDEIYRRQIEQVQGIMRQGKRTATYWISLIHYDDGRYDSAENWLTKRVLDESQISRWVQHAKYNLARTLEREGDYERAESLYKTEGLTQEHGNRIRARLLAKSIEE